MNGRHRPVRLIVLGARERGDDGAALIAVDLLSQGVRRRCEIRRSGGLDVLELVDLPRGHACVIADAARGLPAGSVATLPLERLLAAGDPLPVPRSSHELPVADLLRLALVMRGDLPPGCFVVIGGHHFAEGEGLSATVEAGLPAFVEGIAAAIGEWERCVSHPQAA